MRINFSNSPERNEVQIKENIKSNGEYARGFMQRCNGKLPAGMELKIGKTTRDENGILYVCYYNQNNQEMKFATPIFLGNSTSKFMDEFKTHFNKIHAYSKKCEALREQDAKISAVAGPTIDYNGKNVSNHSSIANRAFKQL